MKLRHAIAVLGPLTALAGCADLQSVSAGHIGCDPAEIEISEEERKLLTHTWIATCKGIEFICTERSGGESTQVSCTERR